MTGQNDPIAAILVENQRRNDAIRQPFDPFSGEGAPLARTRIHIADYPPPLLHVPNTLLDDDRVSRMVILGSVAAYARQQGITLQEALEELEVLRCRHDFFYWAWRYVRIKPKDGGDDIVVYCGNDEDIIRQGNSQPFQDRNAIQQGSFGSAHAGTFGLAMCDGSVQRIVQSSEQCRGNS